MGFLNYGGAFSTGFIKDEIETCLNGKLLQYNEFVK